MKGSHMRRNVNKDFSTHNVNHKNFIIMWHYLKGFAKEHGLKEEDVNIFEMLELPFPKTYKSALQYYTDQSQWSTHKIYVSLYLKIKEITGDPNTFRNGGRAAGKYRKLFTWQMITTALRGPAGAINQIPDIIPDWTDTTEFEIIRPAVYDPVKKIITATVKYVIRPHVKPCDDYSSDPHTLGLFEAIPANFPASFLKPWKFLPMGQARQFMNQYNPVTLYSGIFFKHLCLEPFYKDNKLYIKDPNSDSIAEIGKRVILVSQELNGKMMYLGKYKPLDDDAADGQSVGTLINKTISFRGEPICEAGVMMEGPYFLFNLFCQTPKSARRAWDFRYMFSSKRELMQELFQTNKKLKQEIDDKNKAYNELQYHYDHLETIVQDRTEMLTQTNQSLRRMDQVVMRVVSHGLGNWAAGAIAEVNMIGRSLSNTPTDNIGEHLRRLLSNCGIAALAAIGLNYYCKRDIIITINDIVNFLLRRSYFSNILTINYDTNIKDVSLNGGVYMILSEIFQNAIKELNRHGNEQKLHMGITYDRLSNNVTIILKNKGKLYGNIHILNSDRKEIPDKHQGGWICSKLTKDLGGDIIWAEENEFVAVTIILPAKEGIASA